MTLATIRLVFFFNDTATTEIYTLSLHDALPISSVNCSATVARMVAEHFRNRLDAFANVDGVVALTHKTGCGMASEGEGDRKSTRPNSSHSQISYAVFCLKKKNTQSALPGS